MKTVIITGSTRGIGYGLADQFLARGCNVVISGRTQAAVDEPCKTLGAKYDSPRILGQPCDVADYAQVQALWDAAKSHFGQVDIWVNNAGVGQAIQKLWDIDPGLLDTIVNVNVLGMLYGSKVAVNGFLQQGFGALYIMEGKGGDGRVLKGQTAYSTSKRADNYLFHALVKELEDTPIIVGSLSPGMVVTGLIEEQRKMGEAEWERTKNIFNILGEKVETVTPWLVDHMLSNQKSGSSIQWLTRPKALWRFLMAPFNKRDLFAEDDS